MDTKTVFSLVFFACLAVNRTVVSGARSFSIDYNNNCFQKDGKPFQYISGSIHYSRIPQYYWRDRLLKMYMAGLNAVQIYVPWNFHEEKQGVYNFSGDRDLENFLDLANQTGLLVILRPGPYICAEWEMAVTTWMAVLLPKMRRWLYTNGGNIITVQVENEYGSYYVCDYNYMRHLRTLFRFFLGENTVLFTTDGNTDREMTCGTLEGMYATIDFGTDVNISQAFSRQRRFEPRGPLVNSEFYTGWLDHWGDKHAQVDTQKVSRMLGEMLSMGANVNIGEVCPLGDSGEVWSLGDSGEVCPLGDTGEVWSLGDTGEVWSLGDTGEVCPLGDSGEVWSLGDSGEVCPLGDSGEVCPLGDTGEVCPLGDSGEVWSLGDSGEVGNLSSLLDTLSPQGPVRSRYPLSFEEMKQYYGFMLYRTTLPRDLPEDTPLISPLNGVHDRAYVSVCGVFQGLLERDTTLVMNVTGKEGDQIDVLVENMGRGLLSNLVLGEDVLTNWQIYPLDIDGAIASGWPQSGQRRSPPGPVRGPSDGPVFYQGTLPPNGLARDTFLRLNEWTKGQVWINGMNLGRYWPKRGPQQTLYVPGAPAQPHPAQQHHSPGAREGPSTHQGPLYGPAPARQHCWQDMTPQLQKVNRQKTADTHQGLLFCTAGKT
ncbi:unnamed protein product [Coregonus sp. 'balchen']|nr:unnamed protein product [Coregonus sp. 'balchen']